MLGKTSVLNVIGGRLASSAEMDVSCCVQVAGERINPVTYRRNVAYLMQDDSLMTTATPREALLFSAHLRLEASELVNIHAAVSETLEILGISDCADTLIGGGLLPGISGGQRKRTSVGVELITNPSILILDEPLSGLDSYTAHIVVSVLKRIARSNATVICTIHQPSSQIFQTFDTAIFMKSGRVSYNGSVGELAGWLEGRGFSCPLQYNPADFAMEVLQTHSVQQLEERSMFMEPPPELNPDVSKLDAIAVIKSEMILRKSPSSVLKEIRWLALRETRNVVRNFPALKGRFGTSAVTSLIMGMVFLNVGMTSNTDFQDFKSHNGALTMLGMAAMMLSAIPTLMEFPTERNMFMREHSTGTYSAPSYFVSKALLELPVTFMQILMQWLIAFWMIQFDGNFIFFVVTCWGIAVSIASLAMLLGSMLPDPKEAMETAPMLFMPQIIFAGFFIPTDRIPVWLRWVQYLCGLKYGINLLLMNEFSAGNDDCKGAAAPICSQLLEDNSVYPDKWYVDVLVLIAIFFGFRTVACTVLSYKSAKFY
jgi:ABC-type multidrug transport system ATPase subunit/ABC-type multidrug transport system permease subunit